MSKPTKSQLTAIAAIVLGMSTSMNARAGNTGTVPSAHSDPPANFQPFTLGVEAGTTGAGGHADWRFSNHFGVGTAFDYFEYSYHGNIEGNNYTARLRLMSQPLTLNLYPWKNHSFHVSAGVLFNENHLTGSASGTVNLNGTPYTGTLSLDIKQQVVDPYLSIGGNLYFDRAHHWSLGGELGVFYTGDPRVSLNAVTTGPKPPGFDSNLLAEQNQIQHYAKDAQFWPVLKVSLNYSF